MTEYKKVTLADITTELSDGLHAAPIFCIGGDYIFVNAKNLVNGRIVDVDKEKKTSYEEYLKYRIELDENTILYSIDGTIGNVAKYRGEKVVLGKGACYLKLKPTVDADYIYFYLMSPQFNDYIYSMSTGSTIKHISLKTMRNHSLNLPDLNTQKRISSVLLSIQNKIDLNEQINQNLNEQIQTIYCKDFDPISHEATGVLSDICKLSTDKVQISNLSVSTYYSTENMQPNKAGAVDASSLPSVSQTTRCRKGDVLVSNIRPYFKKIVYATEECGCSTDVLCFVPQPDYSAFLFETLYMDRFFDYMVAGSKGTKMPRGDKQQIMKYPIVVPTTEAIIVFNATVTPMLEQIMINNKENVRLATMRDTLLPRLMSGELDVSELEL